VDFVIPIFEGVKVRGGLMLPQRETMTDSLTDLIQIIYLGRKNGVLTVERMTGSIVEEGYIIFSNGRVVEAKVGRAHGPTAFNYLNTWQACRFSFVSDTERAPQRSSSSLQTPSPLHPTTGDLATNRPRQSGYQNAASNTYYEGPVSSQFPMRLFQGEVALQHPETISLSRTHRRLLLLINGQRSVSELARLLTRSLEEIQALLDDLERAELIQQ
jgi:hypothetical protein